ncbi:MAG: hypothetical protein WBK91_01685 [Alphaproteobacteria bacterium]
MTTYSQRAPFNDWWYWSECLAKRFGTIAEIYRENSEQVRANDAVLWIKKLRENCQPPVAAMRKGMKTDQEKADVKKLEEEAIASAAQMFRELLVNLPFISSAMQDFLLIKWLDCKWEEEASPEEIDERTGLPRTKKKKAKIDQRVMEMFWGPKQRQDEGIRSGKVADGGLPGILFNLLAAEKTSSSRAPTDYGKTMQIAAIQQRIVISKQESKREMNFKPPGGM